MTNLTKNIFSFTSIVLFFFIAWGCNPSQKAFSDTSRFIPLDFNPNNGTLLIQKHPLNSKYNNRMVQYLNDSYHYKYEVVDLKDLEDKSGKYADVKQYPFAIVWNFSSGIGGNVDLYGRFTDRSTGKIYPLTKSNNIYGADGYKPFFNAIINKYK